MKRLAFALVAALLLAGCSAKSSTDESSDFSAMDTNFAEMMIPHHEQALVMSDLALLNSTNPQILELAKEIKAAQAPEIEQMKRWGEVDTQMHMGHTMAGMLTDDEIADLKKTKGSEFDRLFLEGMIKHHEGAIIMARMVEESKNAEVAALAKSIIETQKTEIEKMKDLLSK